jgi:hypothetical protein
VDSESQKAVHLILELDDAIGLVKAGLHELQRIDGANDAYHELLMSLSNGLERLMKVVLCYQERQSTGTFPSSAQWRRGASGHDLEALLGHILKECFTSSYTDRIPAARVDAHVLKSNQRLRRIVRILSDYGKGGRYHNLDGATTGGSDNQSPEAQWMRLEMEIHHERSGWEEELQDGSGLGRVYRRVNKELVVGVELLVRALARLFTLGPLGEEGKRASPPVLSFVGLLDEDLGDTSY